MQNGISRHMNTGSCAALCETSRAHLHNRSPNTFELLKADERDDAEKAAKRLSVTLMTLHASKGLEFPRVFLVGLEEGILPHLKAAQEDTIEEERRLAYVGITRAQRSLQMSYCLERARGGQRVTRHPSRFVLELAQREPPAGWLAAGQEAPPRPRGRRGGRRRRRR